MTGDEYDRDAGFAPSEAGESRSMEERRRRFLGASEKVRRALEARGVTEEDVERDFVEWREARRRSRSTPSEPRTSGPPRL